MDEDFSTLTLESLRDDLKGNVFRDVPGFYRKYFAGRVEQLHNIQEPSHANAKAFAGFRNLEALEQYLNGITHNHYTIFQSQPLSVASIAAENGIFGASITLETAIAPIIAGSSRFFGEYHQQQDPAFDDVQSTKFLRFCHRAAIIFDKQPLRLFLHGFLINGSILELWIFDRSGAYSSGKFDLKVDPSPLVSILCAYISMNDKDTGFNTSIKADPSYTDRNMQISADMSINFASAMLAKPDCLTGFSTICFAGSKMPSDQLECVIKYCWRTKDFMKESENLRKAQARGVKGVIEIVSEEYLASMEELRAGLDFPQSYANMFLSCAIVLPYGRPLQKFQSLNELMVVLRDLVGCLKSLYFDGRMLHRDVSINILVITPFESLNGSLPTKGILIDFDMALDLDDGPDLSTMIGSDGCMAIGILSGAPHTYRHDLESLFYVFLWLAIGNDSEHSDVQDILRGLSKDSRLRVWSTMNWKEVMNAKLADMSPEGFPRVLEEFAPRFSGLKDLARELRSIIFPIRDGKIFIGTDTSESGTVQLYSDLIDAFNKAALGLAPRP